jgi:RNA polymerase sigma-70 factor (ECF subfamily)
MSALVLSPAVIGFAPTGEGRSRRGARVPAFGYGRRHAAFEAIGSNYGVGDDADRIHSDQRLMARIAEGDQQAFASLATAEAPRLLRFVHSLLSDSAAEAEEVVQEALFRLWRGANAWRPDGKISTWLHQVAYRLVIDNLRRRRPAVQIETMEDEIEDDVPAPDARLMQADDVGAVRAAVGALPERQRSALVLCHFQEMNQIEAAAVMGIGEHAYESLLARARRRLRVLLSDHQGGTGGGGMT